MVTSPFTATVRVCVRVCALLCYFLRKSLVNNIFWALGVNLAEWPATQ